MISKKEYEEQQKEDDFSFSTMTKPYILPWNHKFD